MRLDMVAAPKGSEADPNSGMASRGACLDSRGPNEGIDGSKSPPLCEHETGGFLVVCCVRVPEKLQGSGSGSEGNKELIDYGGVSSAVLVVRKQSSWTFGIKFMYGTEE